jgi:hypothetical protein
VPEARILRDGYYRAGSRARPLPGSACSCMHERARRVRARCDGAFAIVSRSCRRMRHRFEHRWRRRSNGSLFRMELTDEQDRAPIVSARSQAASSASQPYGFAKRMMPRQDRNPCLGDERQPPWPVPTTTLAGGAGRKTGMPVWRAAPPA